MLAGNAKQGQKMADGGIREKVAVVGLATGCRERGDAQVHERRSAGVGALASMHRRNQAKPER
jgi:hypothetical protein